MNAHLMIHVLDFLTMSVKIPLVLMYVIVKMVMEDQEQQDIAQVTIEEIPMYYHCFWKVVILARSIGSKSLSNEKCVY